MQYDLQRTQYLLDAAAFLAEVLARYANIELHYVDLGIDDVTNLQSCIIDVYAAILRYAYEIKQANESRAYRT